MHVFVGKQKTRSEWWVFKSRKQFDYISNCKEIDIDQQHRKTFADVERKICAQRESSFIATLTVICIVK